MVHDVWNIIRTFVEKKVRIELMDNDIIKSAILRDVDTFGNVTVFDEKIKIPYRIERKNIIRIVPL